MVPSWCRLTPTVCTAALHLRPCVYASMDRAAWSWRWLPRVDSDPRPMPYVGAMQRLSLAHATHAALVTFGRGRRQTDGAIAHANSHSHEAKPGAGAGGVSLHTYVPRRPRAHARTRTATRLWNHAAAGTTLPAATGAQSVGGVVNSLGRVRCGCVRTGGPQTWGCCPRKQPGPRCTLVCPASPAAASSTVRGALRAPAASRTAYTCTRC